MAPDSPLTSHYNDQSLTEGVDLGEPELSEDEGLPPDQPAFTGHFRQALLKSLLFKTINTAQLGSTPLQDSIPMGQGTLGPLFAEPTKALTCIPTHRHPFLGSSQKTMDFSGFCSHSIIHGSKKF